MKQSAHGVCEVNKDWIEIYGHSVKGMMGTRCHNFTDTTVLDKRVDGYDVCTIHSTYLVSFKTSLPHHMNSLSAIFSYTGCSNS